jgi:hypothetical protein
MRSSVWLSANAPTVLTQVLRTSYLYHTAIFHFRFLHKTIKLSDDIQTTMIQVNVHTASLSNPARSICSWLRYRRSKTFSNNRIICKMHLSERKDKLAERNYSQAAGFVYVFVTYLTTLSFTLTTQSSREMKNYHSPNSISTLKPT